MMAGVHDARTGDERSAQRRYHDDKCPPHLALGVHHVQLCGEVERKVEQSSKRYYNELAQNMGQQAFEPTTAVSGWEALEAILQDVVVGLRADIDGDKFQV
jgi:hypothetical protein